MDAVRPGIDKQLERDDVRVDGKKLAADWAGFVDAWRAGYRPAMARTRAITSFGLNGFTM
ncbi:hypothetical protein D3C83_119180 [compost metagenome]